MNLYRISVIEHRAEAVYINASSPQEAETKARALVDAGCEQVLGGQGETLSQHIEYDLDITADAERVPSEYAQERENADANDEAIEENEVEIPQ